MNLRICVSVWSEDGHVRRATTPRRARNKRTKSNKELRATKSSQTRDIWMGSSSGRAQLRGSPRARAARPGFARVSARHDKQEVHTLPVCLQLTPRLLAGLFVGIDFAE